MHDGVRAAPVGETLGLRGLPPLRAGAVVANREAGTFFPGKSGRLPHDFGTPPLIGSYQSERQVRDGERSEHVME